MFKLCFVADTATYPSTFLSAFICFTCFFVDVSFTDLATETNVFKILLFDWIIKALGFINQPLPNEFIK